METHMTSRTLIVLTALTLSACMGPRAFTKGTYEDPNVIEMLSDKFNENDLQLIAKKMADSMSASAQNFATPPARPLVVIKTFKNSTSEHIDMKSLADKIFVALSKTGKFTFQDVAARTDVAEEYEYQGSGYVDPNKAKGPGEQAAADYVLTGEVSSIVQEVGTDKTVYYKMTSKLTNLRSGVIEWTDEKELRKKFEKQGVSW
jgi:uncharacterized protein (TIGR02722 family)